MKAPPAKSNIPHDTRENWLRAAAEQLKSYFHSLDYKLPDNTPFLVPDNIRFAIAFPSTGRKGSRQGEVWHQSSSNDGHYEIFIRADVAEPAEVLAVLVKELIHTALPNDAGHGKLFRDAALKIGLQPPMRKPTPSQLLQRLLNQIADSLGPLPHASLNIKESPLVAIAPAIVTALDLPKKQRARMLKAECPECAKGSKPYIVRLVNSSAIDPGPPHCPKHRVALTVEWPKGKLGEAEDGSAADAT